MITRIAIILHTARTFFLCFESKKFIDNGSITDMKKHKGRFSQLHSSPVVLVLATILAFFIINAAINMYDKYRDTSVYVDHAQEELVTLKERESELSSKLEALETEEGVEREVRETFGFVREGEKVLVIIDEEPEVEQVLPQKPTLWQKILNFFN